VVDVSTGARLRNVPSPINVEYLARKFHYDTTTKTYETTRSSLIQAV